MSFSHKIGSMGKNPKLQKYRGRLTPTEVARGMNAAARNARRLSEDAQILIDAQRYPSAAALAILSIEEAGKLALLRGISIAPTEKILNDAWRDFRSHREKNVAWIIFDLVRSGATNLKDLAKIFDKSRDHPEILDSLKQTVLYTDCYGDRYWSEPDQAIDTSLARTLVFIANILCPNHETSAREMELWVEIVGPEWGKPTMLDAAVRFHEVLQQEGLGHHDPDQVAAFLGVGREGA